MQFYTIPNTLFCLLQLVRIFCSLFVQCNDPLKNAHENKDKSERVDYNSEQDSNDEVGEIKDNMFESKDCKGEFGNDPIGYSISHARGKKNYFNNAVKQLQSLLVPGKTRTIGETTLMIHFEEKRPYKKIYEVEIMSGNEVGSVTLQMHGPNSKQVYSVGIDISKSADKKFVKLVAELFVKQLLHDAISEKGWEKLNSEDSATCIICKKKFVSEKLMKAHINSKHISEGKILCEKCKKPFKTNITLKTHMKKYHPAVDKNNCQ